MPVSISLALISPVVEKPNPLIRFWEGGARKLVIRNCKLPAGVLCELCTKIFKES